jgi:hypothetical protein
MPNPPWLPLLVWTDYRLALVVLVLAPLALLIWSFVQKSESIQHLLIIYWRVASLLAITVYLMIAGLPVSFFSAWFAKILIPISLWFWLDLNEEIAELRRSQLKLVFTAWRWAVSIYCAAGAIAYIPVLGCGLKSVEAATSESFCRLWLEPPWAFRQMFHANTRPYFLGFLAIAG